ncbi:HEAT repeat domain-containing protein [Parvularcula flava]|nr:HEAT repeat domain-containing protein [Aquisalinus luteolus]NHK28834.1 HEAT repeat domain-containing protein [Aquisalinus luteolus]
MAKVIGIYSLAALLLVLAGAQAATNERPENRDELIANCRTVSSCMALLDTAMPADGYGIYDSDIDDIRKVLKARFGDEAKYALIEKAQGDDPAWQNFASAVLSGWGDWKESDVELLAPVLSKDSGGWIARVLGDIGTEEAIELLVADLRKAGFQSQTGWALYQIGPKVLDRMLPLLELPSNEELPPDAPYTEGWHVVRDLLAEFGHSATLVADNWIAVALDERETTSRRIAALRGLSAMNGYLDGRTDPLHLLLDSEEAAIADQVYKTLVATHDPFVARQYAEDCQPSNIRWERYRSSFLCIRELSEFGSNAAIAGDLILPFLSSVNAEEQLYGIEALGLIGYQPAIPEIEKFLSSPDWRQVYAAVRALGHLKSRASVPLIEEATKEHWQYRVRYHGKNTVDLIIRNQPYTEDLDSLQTVTFYSGFGNYDNLFGYDEDCGWNVWEYGDAETLTFEDAEPVTEVELSGGRLLASDEGEFGGELSWHPDGGEPVVLIPDNTYNIFPIEGGFITIHGISHISINYGFAAKVWRDESGPWQAEEIARFTSVGRDSKRLGPETFAAWTYPQPIIFKADGIIEAAQCDYAARPENWKGNEW